jgi:hypothetical protein
MGKAARLFRQAFLAARCSAKSFEYSSDGSGSIQGLMLGPGAIHPTAKARMTRPLTGKAQPTPCKNPVRNRPASATVGGPGAPDRAYFQTLLAALEQQRQYGTQQLTALSLEAIHAGHEGAWPGLGQYVALP